MPSTLLSPLDQPSNPAAQVVNIAAYKFVTLNDRGCLRERLLAGATEQQLKGTVLLAEEGINLFLAGHGNGIAAWLADLRRDARFADLQVKVSYSHAQPFKRLRVRLKREIITMNRPLVRPESGRAPALSPETLKRWLDAGHDDAGRPVVVLDTRNAFEVALGSFDGAIDCRLTSFGEFPAAAERYAAERSGADEVATVTFCTGGVRCEKAAIVLRGAGLANVWQLDGGILNYLETVGGAHWHGTCFVFDQRTALESDLRPASAPDGFDSND